MSKHYELDKEANVKEKFVPDPADDRRIKDYCPLCIEGGPYLLIYGKDEAGFPVKQCSQCKQMYPMHIAGRIDEDITTSQTSKGKAIYRGFKLSKITNKKEKDQFF